MRRVVLSSAIALALLPALGSSVSADRGCGGSGKPPCTILRHVDEASPPERSGGWGQDCIVIVGGLGSPTDGSDAPFFTHVLGDLTNSIDHRLIRFGVDRGSYDTRGALSRSGAALRSVLRGIARDCDAIHLLAHSMGGVVVDRALSKVEPERYGISTYVALASPHNGATLARAVSAVARAAEAVGLGDPAAEAVDDLARMQAPRRMPRVEHVRVRISTDPVVLYRDVFDRRADVRELDPASLTAIEGHGGIVRDHRVQELVRETIRRGRVPAERRGSW